MIWLFTIMYILYGTLLTMSWLAVPWLGMKGTIIYIFAMVTVWALTFYAIDDATDDEREDSL